MKDNIRNGPGQSSLERVLTALGLDGKGSERDEGNDFEKILHGGVFE